MREDLILRRAESSVDGREEVEMWKKRQRRKGRRIFILMWDGFICGGKKGYI